MRLDNKSSTCATLLAIVGAMSAVSAYAATSIETSNFQFTPEAATQTLSVKAQSWYNPTMGYLGWTHHSNWGYMVLKKDKPVTITVTTAVEGVHPAITVWFRPQKKGFASVKYMADHFYKEFLDIYIPKAELTDDPANPIKIGIIRMDFIANAFDRDGMVDPLPAQFDQSMLSRVLDGKSGEVSLTFTPKENGVYQFVVGGINPDAGVSTTDRHNLDVTVSFPQ